LGLVNNHLQALTLCLRISAVEGQHLAFCRRPLVRTEFNLASHSAHLWEGLRAWKQK